MRKRMLAGAVLMGAMSLVISGCGSADPGTGSAGTASSGGGTSDLIKVGFAQTGSESGWRSREHGVDEGGLLQGERLRPHLQRRGQRARPPRSPRCASFINQEVDAIVIAPIVEDGWDDVLKEAQAAKIPVILEDRTRDGPRRPVRELGRDSTSRRRA